ncbi:YccF domain-containing protein [Pseudomonas chlororaphis]|uniref:YccF domain-containing protein n=1 Tax=Pseudomonas chlororaphis TaxID=587753 RepID=UPI000ACA50E4|nr:YccF domain-containing protein [Pseudomonas chlororaphis]
MIGAFSFFPFGKEAISRRELNNIGTSGLGVIGNVLWFVFGGIWLALGHESPRVSWRPQLLRR